MSQLNVDTIKNRLGTAGPTVPSLSVTNNTTVGGALTVTGNLGVGVANPASNTQVAIAGTLGISEVGGSGTRTLFTSTGSGFVINHNDNSNITIQSQGSNRLAYQFSSNSWSIPSGFPLFVGSATSTGTASQPLQVTGGAYVSSAVGIGTVDPAATGSTLGVAGTITELYQGQYWNVVTQADVGIGASQVPLNQYLGQLAFVDEYSPTTLLTPRLQSVGERTTLISGNTVNLTYNTGGGNIAICTNPTGDITLNVTGIPTDSSFDNTSLTFSVFVNNTGTARSCTAVNLNGVPETIRWAGGSLAAAVVGVTTSNGYDIYSFTGINTVGSAATAANYHVLGVVNGGYR